MSEVTREPRPKVFGVTGLAGSGKSYFLRLLEARGHRVLDTDQVSRWVVDPTRPDGQRGLSALILAFGHEILTPHGHLDRTKMRALLVASPEARARMEAILHPLIVEAVEKVVRGWGREGAPAAFVEGTRLIESGFAEKLDGLLLITSPEAQRRERLMKRDKIDAAQVEALLRIQDEEVMRRAATTTIVNDDDETALTAKLNAWLRAEDLA